jgi:hypothetical protein
LRVFCRTLLQLRFCYIQFQKFLFKEKYVSKTKRDVAIAGIELELAGCQAELDTVEKGMSERRVVINKLNAKQSADQGRQSELVHKAGVLQNRIFARSVLRGRVFDKVHSARKAYFAQLAQSQSDDITVANKRHLIACLELALPAMQSICPHPFVFSYDGYRGSSSYDGDDARYGHRTCTVCNSRETSKDTASDKYDLLAQDGTRLVRRDLRQGKDRVNAYRPEWFTLEFLQDLFERSAGGINISWPDMSDSKRVFALCDNVQ